MSKIIKALIPVRGGSVRVKDKNIRPFADSNLLEIKIKQLQRIKKLDGIVVNSDSEEMLSLAKKLGVETIKRDSYFASSTISPNELYVNIADNFNADVMLFSNVTNPLITDLTINNCIDFFFENEKLYNSVNTVNDVKEFLWLDNKPINYDKLNKPKSQDLPNIVSINHAVNILYTKNMKKYKDIIGTNPYFYKIDKIEAIDIDDMIDFELAEFMYKKLRMGK